MLDTTNNDGFQRELARVAEARREQQRVLKKREAALAELEAASQQIERRRSELIKEREDVARLEAVSLTRIMTSLRGELDDTLRQERAEWETARVAFLTAEDREAAAVRALRAVDDRLAALGDVEAEWNEVIDARERWILATSQPPETALQPHDGEVGTVSDPERVIQLVERRGEIEAEMREVNEALSAAHIAAGRLALASSVLGSAQSWSTYDTWFGGGMIASMFKHDKLDDAAEVLRDAEVSLTTLRRELADLATGGVATLTFDRWDHAFDTFFDNIFTDISVDRRIKAAAEQVQDLRSEVAKIVFAVHARGVELEAEAAALTEERSRLLS